MKKYLILDKEHNKLKQVVSSKNIKELKEVDIYKGKEIVEEPTDFETYTDDLRYYDKNLKLKTLEALITDGLEPPLSDDEAIQNNIRVKLDELGFYKKNKDKAEYQERFKLLTLDKDSEGREYLRALTMLEQLDKKLITAEEYNEYQINLRKQAYTTNTDPLVIEKMLLYLAENNIDISDIENKKLEIKTQYSKAEVL